MTSREKVAATAAYLDERKPDWWATINPLTLDLYSSENCVCGQNGLNWLREQKAVCERLGLKWDELAVFADNSLAPLWLEEIAARLPAAEPVVQPSLV